MGMLAPPKYTIRTTTNTDIPVGDGQTDEIGPGIFDSFKDSMGRFRTQSLFIETPNVAYPAYFTLKKSDTTKAGHTYISLYRKYMAIADPTEYQVAVQLFGSWSHWQALMKSQWFMDNLNEWRYELRTRLESERYHEMKEHIKDDPKSTQAMQATKWLAGRYGDAKQAKRGRPSKLEKEQALRQATEDDKTLNEDAKRIGLGWEK